MAELTMLNVRIPVDMHRRLKVLAAQTGRPMAELTAEAINDLLTKYGKAGQNGA